MNKGICLYRMTYEFFYSCSQKELSLLCDKYEVNLNELVYYTVDALFYSLESLTFDSHGAYLSDCIEDLITLFELDHGGHQLASVIRNSFLGLMNFHKILFPNIVSIKLVKLDEVNIYITVEYK